MPAFSITPRSLSQPFEKNGKNIEPSLIGLAEPNGSVPIADGRVVQRTT